MLALRYYGMQCYDVNVIKSNFAVTLNFVLNMHLQNFQEVSILKSLDFETSFTEKTRVCLHNVNTASV